ncbi:hypothetical protein SAHL_04925 [Salinisphaera orenii YIM 95161]|uniref:Glycosyl transferase family 1 domain-containing protein n=2 Tax=Salinisphaera TaxID=180541 RepID=A0A423Q1X4_9GAMM|nr:hypothetical protein SAHL_04925 [Salinisphaera halophila YIM 95161]
MSTAAAFTAKRILMPLPGNGIGGAQMSAMLLAQGLANEFAWHAGIALDRSTMSRKLFEDSGLEVLTASNLGTPDVRLSKFRLGRAAHAARAAGSALRVIRQFRPDVVTLNTKSGLIPWALAARTAQVPVVWYVRGCRRTRYDSVRTRLSSRIVFAANAVASSYADLPLPPHTTIRNGVRATFFDTDDCREDRLRREIEAADDDVIVLFVGNLIPRKRPLWAARCLSEVIRRSDVPVRFVIAGEDRDNGQTTQALNEIFSAAGVASNLHVLGHRQDIPELMRDSDILILTSEPDGEAFPRVIIEAMACGLPVISTDVAGVDEAVQDGQTGMLIGPHDEPGFVSAVSTLVHDSRMRQQMSGRAVTCARDNFQQSHVVHQFNDFLSDL